MKDKKASCNRKGCGSSINLVKSTKRIQKDGSIKQYYMCRKCNTDYCKQYRKTKEGRKNIYKAVYKSIKKHSHKQKARIEVRNVLKRGEIIKPVRCVECLLKKKLEAHHMDYRYPLLVLWVCRQCHATVHRKLKEKGLKIT